MSENLASNEQQYDPWEFGASLLNEAKKIQRYIQHRDPRAKGTITNLFAGVVQPLTQEHAGTEVFVKSVNAHFPHAQGIGVGFSESQSTIIGFGYGEHYTGSFDEGTEFGLIMYVAVDSLTGEKASDLPYRLNLLPDGVDPQTIPGAVIGVPITEGVRVAKIQEGITEPDALTDSAFEADTNSFDYMEFVHSIHEITGQRATGIDIIDTPKEQAAFKILTAMNSRCPYLGKSVEITSGNIRVKNPLKSTYLLLDGTVQGVLRKFVIDIYQDQHTKELKSDVQAVVYHPDLAEQVYSGKISPQEADKLPLAFFIPLGIPHELKVLG